MQTYSPMLSLLSEEESLIPRFIELTSKIKSVGGSRRAAACADVARYVSTSIKFIDSLI